MTPEPTLLRRLDNTGIPLLLARLALGGLFVYMAWSKVVHPTDFMKLIREYHMVPESWPIVLNLIAAVLPWVEIMCGMLLIFGVALRGTSLMLLLMLIGFTIIVTLRAVGIHQTTGQPFCTIKFDCGCGAGEQYICAKIPENLGMCLLSIIILISRSRRWCLRGDLVAIPAM